MALRRTLIFIPILALALILGWPALLHAENAIRYTDAVVRPGDIVSIDMVMSNDVVISGASIPFRWSSPDVELVDITIHEDRFRGDMEGRLKVADPVERTAGILLISKISIFSQGYIEAGTGVIATGRFRVLSGAPDQVVYVDSVYVDLGGGAFDRPQFSNFQGTQVIFPETYAGQIVVGSPALEVDMRTSPESMLFESTELGFDPPSQTLNLDDTNGNRFNWDANWSSEWLEVTPQAGSAPSFISVRAVTQGLSQGTYRDIIYLSSAVAANSPILVPVVLSVGPPQVRLSASPQSLELDAYRPLGDTLNRVIGITADATSPINWSAVNTQPWLQLSQSTGGTPTAVTVSIDLRGYPFQDYRDTIIVVSDIAVNSPLRIPVKVSLDTIGVQLNVIPSPLYLSGGQPVDTLARATLTLSSSPAVPLDWSASWDANWLQLSEWSGTTPSTVEATANVKDLLLGTYTDSITIFAAGAENSTTHLLVTLNVAEVDTFDYHGLSRVLVQNYPNPLNLSHEPGTTIGFYIAEPDRVELVVYNMLGQRIRSLVSGERGSGTQSVYWDGRDANGEYVPSGHYFYRMTTSKGTVTKRMIVIK